MMMTIVCLWMFHNSDISVIMMLFMFYVKHISQYNKQTHIHTDNIIVIFCCITWINCDCNQNEYD